MIPGLEKPRVTEIRVRMDCNGCVQKIKKALYGINGIYDLYIDFPQQKLTIIGWADPEKIVKAIRKTRKIATICSHTELPDPPPPEQPPEQPPPPENNSQQPETVNHPSSEQPQPENNPSPPPDPPVDPRPPERPPQPEAIPSMAAAEANAGPGQPPKDVGEVHVVYHHPPPAGYGYRYGYVQPGYEGHSYTGQWNKYPAEHQFSQPQPNIQVTHSYNTYKPSPYVTEYAYSHSQPQPPPQGPPPSPHVTEYAYSHSHSHSQPPPPSPHVTEYANSHTQPPPPPSPHVTEYANSHSQPPPPPSPPYVTSYAYSHSQPPPPSRYMHYNRMDQYNDEYLSSSSGYSNGNGNGNITSIFSDENPNACTIC
ncbi:hypothetical protein ACFE04_006338 [Oxalis oulophora]